MLCRCVSAALAGLLIAGATSTAAQDLTISGTPTRDHGRQLLAALEAQAGQGAGQGLLVVEDDTGFLDGVWNGGSVEDTAEAIWQTTLAPVCGLRGHDKLLVSLDDGSGTPTDYMRQVMVSAGAPLPVYIGLDIIELMTITALARWTGDPLSAVYHGSDIQSDGRLLSNLRRQGGGMALIDARHAGAPGFAVALTFGDNDAPDVPSLNDLDIAPLPPRFAAIYAGETTSAEVRALAMQACQQDPERFLSPEVVQAAKADILAIHRELTGAGSND